jgi:hypothetical protein
MVPVFFHSTWALWKKIGRMMRDESRERWLGVYGPFAMVSLLALWVALMMAGFAMIEWSLNPQWPFWRSATEAFAASGSAMFTVSTGSYTDGKLLGRIIAVTAAGTGLAFLTIVITYVPVLYQLFSRRESHVILLDTRTGGAPTAAALLCRHARAGAMKNLTELLGEWEEWSAEILESHISYPMLSYYRSQHRAQPWLSAIGSMLDVCGILMTGVRGSHSFAAEACYVMTGTALREMIQILRIDRINDAADRLPPDEFQKLTAVMRSAGLEWDDPEGAGRKLAEYRRAYEPMLAGLGNYFEIAVPKWIGDLNTVDPVQEFLNQAS